MLISKFNNENVEPPIIELEAKYGTPVTTDIPMLRDEIKYKVYILLKGNQCNNIEIKAVSKVCNINYIHAKNKLKEKKNLIIQGDAYEIRDILKKLSQYEVDFEIEPPYPYGLE